MAKRLPESQRIVTSLPITELWNATGIIPGTKGAMLASHQIEQLLKSSDVIFVIADCGHQLKWLLKEKGSQFWKDEIRPRLVEPAAAEKGFSLDDYPASYAYLGFEWLGPSDVSIVVLEKQH